MDYFSVFYHGIEDALQEEEQIYRIVDEQCSEIFKIMGNVTAQPTLWGHGYSDKLWEAYSQTSVIASYISRMQTGLGKVFDKYVEYEQKVLNEAEDVITVKNGFSKSAVNSAKAAVEDHEKFEEANQKEAKNWKDAFYAGTVGSWKENWGLMKKNLNGAKEMAKEGYSVLRDNFYDIMENSILPPFVVGGIKKLIGKAESTVSDYADILGGILDYKNPEAVKEAILGTVSQLDVFDLGAEDMAESIFDLTAEDSALMQRYEEIQQRTADALREGNYGEAAVIFFGGGIETMAVGTTEVGFDWITAQADGKLGSATELFVGKKIKFKDIGEGIADYTGVNPGTIIADIGTDINNGVSSALDGFADWLGGMSA